MRWRAGLIEPSRKAIAIIGPTGSGKSSLAHELALKFNGEIISCDSVALYSGFDIGSAKATLEEQKQVPYHMIDVADLNQTYDASTYREKAQAVIQEIIARGKCPIIVGGSTMYYRALLNSSFHSLPHDPKLRAEIRELQPDKLRARLKALDPKREAELHENDLFRYARALELAMLTGKTFAELTENQTENHSFPVWQVALVPQRPKLHQRIEKRVEFMLANGLVEEVRILLKQGALPDSKPMQSIGYREVIMHLNGEISLKDLPDRILFATRQYAKRQVTALKQFKFDQTIESADGLNTDQIFC